ncbi:amidohydrolase family protein [Pseudonocardia yuanmonensis]|uniref:2-amino-3-carboxymuconate-6-semialdehyde decarboxylase n=1 Tax=Pseudonocardia yuanmonensis TaxID=1095914 RepID=A0ABP8XPD0_9PSEU
MPSPVLNNRPVTGIDVHAHYLDPALRDLPGVPRLVVDREGGGRYVLGGRTIQPLPSGLWDPSRRLEELDGCGISHQVISPAPVAMHYAWSADPAYARAVNDSMAAVAEQSDGRLIGLGCLPSASAVEEVHRCRELGLSGIEVGTRIGDLDLDAPELAEVWAACEETGSSVFVHPIAQGRGVLRRDHRVLDLGVGQLADTAIAASSLLLGGVLERHPGLRVAFAHGCGAFAWCYPRIRVGSRFSGQGNGDEWDQVVRRIYADALVFDAEHLRIVAHRFGPDRILLASDAPYLSGQLAKSLATIDAAIESGALPSDSRDIILVDNALEFLGLQ